MMHDPALLDNRATAGDVVRVLCEAFADYPVMRYVLGERAPHPERLRTLIGFFHGARVLRDDAILGVSDGNALVAVALCSLPDREDPPELDQLAERTWPHSARMPGRATATASGRGNRPGWPSRTFT